MEDDSSVEEDTYKDPAVEEVEKEDEEFKQNADMMDVNGVFLDLALMEKYKKAKLLGKKMWIVEKRWKHLCDPKAHAELQKAVINHLFCDD